MWYDWKKRNKLIPNTMKLVHFCLNTNQTVLIRYHLFSTCAKLSRIKIFFISCYANVHMVRNICVYVHNKWMNPKHNFASVVFKPERKNLEIKPRVIFIFSVVTDCQPIWRNQPLDTRRNQDILDLLWTFYVLSIYVVCPGEGIIQAVLLITVFGTKIEFSNLVKCRWRSRGVVNSATCSWWSLGEGSGVKRLKHFSLFTSGGQKESLK